jgi:hypothetical protein
LLNTFSSHYQFGNLLPRNSLTLLICIRLIVWAEGVQQETS